jgi:tellurite resistance-related uncharacterized protein
VIRTILEFHQDEESDWVADLSCLHGQHVRHRPPFNDRAWVETAGGRASRVGTEIDCPLCDRAELPDMLRHVRTAGPFDAETLPRGLRQTHRVGESTWGLLRVIEGSVRFSMETDPPIEVQLDAGAQQPIPPMVPHRLTLDGPVVLTVDFLVRDGDGRD